MVEFDQIRVKGPQLLFGIVVLCSALLYQTTTRSLAKGINLSDSKEYLSNEAHDFQFGHRYSSYGKMVEVSENDDFHSSQKSIPSPSVWISSDKLDFFRYPHSTGYYLQQVPIVIRHCQFRIWSGFFFLQSSRKFILSKQ